MLDVRLGRHSLDLPYIVHVHGVTEDLFERLAGSDVRAELLDEVMVLRSYLSPREDDLANFVRILLGAYASAKDLGVVLGPRSVVRLGPARLLAPSSYWSAARLRHPLPEKYLVGVPDLVVEFVGPSNRDHQLRAKRALYQEARAPEIWFLDRADQAVLVD